jgi:hypothetical protein
VSGWLLTLFLLAATPTAGVLAGLILHWCAELRALRPAYRQERAAARGER